MNSLVGWNRPRITTASTVIFTLVHIAISLVGIAAVLAVAAVAVRKFHPEVPAAARLRPA